MLLSRNYITWFKKKCILASSRPLGEKPQFLQMNSKTVLKLQIVHNF